MRASDRLRRAPQAIASFLAVLVVSGCAGYSTSVREAQVDLRAGRPESALQVLNQRLKVEQPEDIPADLQKSRLLLLLERATLLQALGRYDLAARDMMAVDQRMEWLDIDGAKSADLAQYLYSGSATPYRAPAYERMMLNTLNMVNFLVLGDIQGAKVEARRFRLLEEFFVDGVDSKAVLVPQILALGNYLGGVAFDASRDHDIAVRYYGRAWAYGFRPPWFQEQLVELGRVTGWRGRGVATPENGLEDVLIEAGLKGAMRGEEYRRRHVRGNVIIVTQTGLAPYKVPERVPIGAAIVLSSSHHGHGRLTHEQYVQANQMAVAGALKWVNFPRLTDSGTPPRAVLVTVDGAAAPTSHIANVSDQVRSAWDRIAGALIGSAILRMITRAVAGGATRAGARALAKSEDSAAIGALGWLAGVALEGALTAADVPDTRSWTTLPANIHISRIRVEPGVHQVAVQVDSRTETRPVEVLESMPKVLNFSRAR